MTANARDVIARTLPDAIRDATRIYPEPGIVQRVTVYPDIADDIIAALNDAGYMIVSIPPSTHVPNLEPSEILLNAFGEPDSIEEVAPNTFKYTWPNEDEI